MGSAERVVMEVIASATGYEVDMLDFDMSLEEECGIDSIKRVEILSAVQEKLSVEVSDVDALSRTKTIGDVIACMRSEIGTVVAATPVVAKSAEPTKSAE